jgi:hypothetical protein
VWEEVRRLNERLGMTIFLTRSTWKKPTSWPTVSGSSPGPHRRGRHPAELKARLSSEAINVALRSEADVERARAALDGLAERTQTDRAPCACT